MPWPITGATFKIFSYWLFINFPDLTTNSLVSRSDGPTLRIELHQKYSLILHEPRLRKAAPHKPSAASKLGYMYF